MNPARQPLHREVAEKLSQRILSGEFPERSLLPTERELCDSLGVSRTVVREAVKFLESRGLVRIERGRGMVVAEPHTGPAKETFKFALRGQPGLMAHLLEVRQMLEVDAAGLAAMRRTPENLQAMRECLELMRRKPTEPEGYVDADVRFHDEVLRAAQNPVLLLLLEPVTELLRESRQRSFSGREITISRTAQHQEIYERIAAADAQGAREAMSRHLRDTEADLARFGNFSGAGASNKLR